MNKMKFILPRLFGLAAIAGIAAFLLTMVFKLLLCAALIGSIAYFAARRFKGRHGYDPGQFGPHDERRFDEMQRAAAQYYGGQVVPVRKAQHSSGIIPIN